MRACLRTRRGRAGIWSLALWVVLATVGLGSHVPSPDGAGLWAADGEHQPWHRHFIDDGIAARGPGLDHCVVCLVKVGSWTLGAGLVGAHRDEDPSGSLYLRAQGRGGSRLPVGHTPRAPPTA